MRGFRLAIAVSVVVICIVLASAGAMAAPGQSTATSDAAISDALVSSNGTQTVIVRLTDAPTPPVSATTADARGMMQQHATASQQPFERFAAGNPYVEIERSFWITNALVVSVDTDRIPLRRLAGVENVRLLHDNFNIRTASVTADPGGEIVITQPTPASDHYTWGLDRIGVPQTWTGFDNRGDGVTVAVLDTGVDESHPDIAVANWTDTSDTPSSTPKDYGEHGTHVSGTIVGGDASGTHIGVAPDATLDVAAVLTDCSSGPCGGSFDQIITGLEWAVDNNADIASMSLGVGGKYDAFIDPVRNAREAGTIPVVSIGNGGVGTSSSPGNVYESIAVGASNSNGGIASFSGGETIRASEWDNPPSEWPESYIVPDLVAPGTDTYSSIPGNTYGTKSGTSMAAPHLSGTLALMLSNGGSDPTPTQAESRLESNTVDLGFDADRQGVGRIDAYNATVDHSWATLYPVFTPTQANVSIPVNLTVAANHPITRYNWTLPNGSTVTTGDSTLAYTFEQRGTTETIDIELTDVQGNTRTDTLTVNVVDEIKPQPSLTTNRTTAEVGVDTVRFNASNSTDNDAIDRYEWAFGDGTTTTTLDPVINHTYKDRGSRNVTLTVVDAVGNENTTTISIDIVDTTPPTPRIDAPKSAAVNMSVSLSATNSIDNDAIASYEWTFGDGTTKSGEVITCRFETTGAKRVTLNTTDRAGNSATNTTNLTVRSVPSVSIIEPTDGRYVTNESVMVRYRLSNTSTDDAAGLQYRVTDAIMGDQISDWESATFSNTTAPITESQLISPLTDGNYTVDLRIIDTTGAPLGSPSASTNVSFAVKTTDPSVTLDVTSADRRFGSVGPHNPAIINTTVTDPLSPKTTLTITNQADTTVATWDLSTATGSGESVFRRWNATDSTDTLVDNGGYTVTAQADDGVGNSHNETATVSVDTKAPKVAIESIDGGRQINDTWYLNASTVATVTVSADNDGEGIHSVDRTTLTASADTMNYRRTPTLSRTTDSDTRWTATFAGSELAEHGRYTLTATATDSANNTNTSAGSSIVYDPTPPNLSVVVTTVDPDTDTATVRVRASDTIVGSPSVRRVNSDGQIKGVELKPNGDRWTGTFDVSAGGQYTLTATGTDRAGNRGSDRATAIVDADVTTTNRTALVYEPDSGIYIRVNTTTSVENRTVALTSTDISPEPLANSQRGVRFLEGTLDDVLSAELDNATVGIPVNKSTLPTGISVNDEQVQISHYENGWQDEPTTLKTVDLGDGTLRGPYWTTTVESFSSYGVTVKDTTPPDLTEATAKLSANRETVTLQARYADDLTDINRSSISLYVDNIDKTDSINTSITSSTATHTGYPVGTGVYNLTTTLTDEAGNYASYQRTVSVDTAADDSTDENGGDGGGSSSGGGQGGGQGGTGKARPTDSGPPTVQNIRDTLKLVSPSSDTNTEIIDSDADRPGLQVRPEGTESVRKITFENDVTGSVNIREYNSPPQYIRNRVSQSVNAAGAVDRSGMSVVNLADITPDNDAAEDSPATVTFAVPASEVDDPEQLTVVKEIYSFAQQQTTWSELPTTLKEAGKEEVTVSAQAQNFSLFTVVEIKHTDEPADTLGNASTDSLGNNSADDSSTSDGSPGFGVIIALFSLFGFRFYVQRNA